MGRFCRAVSFFGMAFLFTCLCQAKQQEWVEVRSPNFIVVSNAGEKQARKAAIQFEQIRAAFRESLENAKKHPSPLITILAVKDESSMRELLPEYWAKGHSHPTGFFAALLNQFYAAVELDAPGSNPYENFYHEYYHTISVPYVPDLPLWLAEGLAEFYGHSRITDDYVIMGEADPILLHELRNHSLIPLSTLFEVNRTSPYYNEADKTSIFYAESWALVHYLMIGDRMAHRSMLDQYLSVLGQGKGSEQAARATFGDLKKLQSDLQNYIYNARYYQFKYPPPALHQEEPKARTISEAEAAAYRGGLFAVRGRTQDAMATLQEALRSDPNLALAYENLAITQYLERQREKALDSVSRAINLDPKNSFTRYFRAYLATNLSGPASGNAQTEEDLRQAIVISPEFDPPYGLLAVYLATLNRNLEEALSLAQHAVSSQPANSDYQLALAQVFLHMNKFEAAEAATARAAACARNATEKQNAEGLASYLQTVRDYRVQNSGAALKTHDSSPSDGPVENASPETEKSSIPNKAEKSPAPAYSVQIQASINLLSDALGFDFIPYFRQVMEAVRRNVAGNAATGHVTQRRSLSLEFSILKNGEIAGLKVSSSSGDAGLDEFTRECIAASSPLPALPREFRGQYVRLHFGLSYEPAAAN